MSSTDLTSKVKVAAAMAALVLTIGWACGTEVLAANGKQSQADKPVASSAQSGTGSEGAPSASTASTSAGTKEENADSQAKASTESSQKSQEPQAEGTAKPEAGKRAGRGKKIVVPRSRLAAAPAVTDKLSKARSDLISATEAYKTSLSNLLPYEESAVKAASDQVTLRQSLFEKGIVSRKELEDSKHGLAEAQTKLDETRRQLSESDSMLAEVEDDQYLKIPAVPGQYTSIGAVIRYTGSTKWTLKDASEVENFYESEFGQQLSISAFGQTAVHDRLGFDHHDAMDVAVQPDSPRGEALMEYLRKEGIPFIAFRHAVPGSATGAHIHIGKPSHRIAVHEPAASGR